MLVSLDDVGVRPTFYVVPRDHVAALAHCTNEIYLAARPGRRTSRPAIKVRDVERYKEQWELLDHDADEAPWMISEWVWEAALEYPPPVILGPFARPEPPR